MYFLLYFGLPLVQLTHLSETGEILKCDDYSQYSRDYIDLKSPEHKIEPSYNDTDTLRWTYKLKSTKYIAY